MTVLAFALVPTLGLLFYVWHIDRLEHEPIRQILAAFGFGMLSIIPAIIAELIGDTILEWLLPADSVLFMLIDFFLVVAPAEELSKRLVMRPIFWHRPDFNCRFDAVVYCIAAALGFAAAENLEYGIMGELSIGRLFPVHTICGLFMGYELGRARMAQEAGDKKAFRRLCFLSVLIPVLIHGSWDFLVSVGSDLLCCLALAGMTGLMIFAAIWMHRLQKFDAPFVPFRTQVYAAPPRQASPAYGAVPEDPDRRSE